MLHDRHVSIRRGYRAWWAAFLRPPPNSVRKKRAPAVYFSKTETLGHKREARWLVLEKHPHVPQDQLQKCCEGTIRRRRSEPPVRRSRSALRGGAAGEDLHGLDRY